LIHNVGTGISSSNVWLNNAGTTDANTMASVTNSASTAQMWLGEINTDSSSGIEMGVICTNTTWTSCTLSIFAISQNLAGPLKLIKKLPRKGGNNEQFLMEELKRLNERIDGVLVEEKKSRVLTFPDESKPQFSNIERKRQGLNNSSLFCNDNELDDREFHLAMELSRNRIRRAYDERKRDDRKQRLQNPDPNILTHVANLYSVDESANSTPVDSDGWKNISESLDRTDSHIAEMKAFARYFADKVPGVQVEYKGSVNNDKK